MKKDCWAQQMLQRVSEAAGFSSLEFDEKGVCLLEVDGMFLSLEQRDNGNALFLSARIAELPEKQRMEWLAELLEANVYFNGTAGAMFAVTRIGSVVLLQRECNEQSGDFEDILNVFLAVAFQWRTRLQSGAPVGQNPQDALNAHGAEKSVKQRLLDSLRNQDVILRV